MTPGALDGTAHTRCRVHTRRRIAAGSLLLLLLAHPAASQDIVLRAQPAFGGAVKADRWTPLRVTLSSTRPSFSGDLLVMWGDARLRRAVSLPSPGQRDYDLNVRTAKPEAVIRVQLLDGGQPIHNVDVPVRIIANDEPFTVCVTSDSGGSPDAACTTTTTASPLPASLRGYEAVDEVFWPGGGYELSFEQRTAYDDWTEFRRLERSGDLGLTPQPTRPLAGTGLPTRAARAVAALWALWGASLAVVGIITVRQRLPISVTFGLIAALTVASGGTAYAIGRAGGGAVDIQHVSVLHQIPHSQSSLLSMRGLLAFPALGRFRVTMAADDGDVQRSAPAGRPEQGLDEAGRAMIDGLYGLGARQGYAAEAVLAAQPLSITQEGNTFTVANRSGLPLRDCQFADGFSVQKIESLAAGVSVAAERKHMSPGPILTCVTDAEIIQFSASNWPVVMNGTTTIAAYGVGGKPLSDGEALLSKLGLIQQPEADAATKAPEEATDTDPVPPKLGQTP